MAMSPYIRGLRSAVGNALLLVPSVSGIVRNGDGRVLLVQEREAGVWSTPGGSIEPNETPANAVVREVWEEAGLTVKPVRVLGVYGGPEFVVRYSNGDQTQYLNTIFECEVVSGSPRADGEETSAVKFFSLDEARTLPLSPWLARVLPKLYESAIGAWFEEPTWRPPSER